MSSKRVVGELKLRSAKKKDGKMYGDKQSHLWGLKEAIEHFCFWGFSAGGNEKA